MLAIVSSVGVRAQLVRLTCEVASVKKQSARIPGRTTWGPVGPGEFYWSNVTVATLMQFAYNVTDFEVVGLPEWARKDLFEIRAKSPTTNQSESRLRLQRCWKNDSSWFFAAT
jgi:uncharacterized protein (TIGR03435 family)